MKSIYLILTAAAFFVPFTYAQSSTNDMDMGLQIYRRAPEKQMFFLMTLAKAYFDDKDYDAAADVFNRVLTLDPNHEEARYSLGSVYINAKQWVKAESILIKMIDEYPKDYKLKNNLAWLYATSEDLSIRDGKKAIQIAQEAMVIAPTDHHVWSTLSEAYYVSGEYEKAYRAIKHMASLASRYAKNVNEATIESYNDQIRKCKRALDTAEALKAVDE